MDPMRHDVTSAAAPGASPVPLLGRAAAQHAVQGAARDLFGAGPLFAAFVLLGFLAVGPLLVVAVEDGLHARERAARHAVVLVHQQLAHQAAVDAGFIPDRLTKDVYDPWSTPLLLVRMIGAPYFAVVSAGPDRAFFTADDVRSARP
jgi:hypothetical protein